MHQGDDIHADIDVLLESLKCNALNPSVLHETLNAFASVCSGNDTAKQSISENGGIQLIWEICHSSVYIQVKQAAFYALGCIIERHFEAQRQLTKPNVFGAIYGSLSTSDDPSSILRQLCVFLILCLTTNNKMAQGLVRNSKCLSVLMDSYQSCLKQMLTGDDRDDSLLSLWSSLSSTISVCVSNPQNDENQRLCSILFPRIICGLQETIEGAILTHIVSLLGSIISNNVFNQQRFQLCGGLQTLVMVLYKLYNRLDRNTFPLSIRVVHLLDICVTDNAINACHIGELDVVSLVLKLLACPQCRDDDRLQIIIMMGHCIELSDVNKLQLVESDGLQVLTQILNCSKNEEVNKSLRYLLHVSFNKAMTPRQHHGQVIGCGTELKPIPLAGNSTVFQPLDCHIPGRISLAPVDGAVLGLEEMCDTTLDNDTIQNKMIQLEEKLDQSQKTLAMACGELDDVISTEKDREIIKELKQQLVLEKCKRHEVEKNAELLKKEKKRLQHAIDITTEIDKLSSIREQDFEPLGRNIVCVSKTSHQRANEVTPYKRTVSTKIIPSTGSKKQKRLIYRTRRKARLLDADGFAIPQQPAAAKRSIAPRCRSSLMLSSSPSHTEKVQSWLSNCPNVIGQPELDQEVKSHLLEDNVTEDFVDNISPRGSRNSLIMYSPAKTNSIIQSEFDIGLKRQAIMTPGNRIKGPGSISIIPISCSVSIPPSCRVKRASSSDRSIFSEISCKRVIVDSTQNIRVRPSKAKVVHSVNPIRRATTKITVNKNMIDYHKPYQVVQSEKSVHTKVNKTNEKCPGCQPPCKLNGHILNSRTMNVALETSPYTCEEHRRQRKAERDYIREHKEHVTKTKRPVLKNIINTVQNTKKGPDVYDFNSSESNDKKPLSDTDSVTSLQDANSLHSFKRRRPRQPYSDQEMQNLVDGVEKLGNFWNQILLAYKFHESRTAVDLRKKYKQIQRSLQKEHSSPGKGKRFHSHIPFSLAEDRRLRRGVYKYGHNWKVILRYYTFVKGRTDVDLRSRWRYTHKGNRK